MKKLINWIEESKETVIFSSIVEYNGLTIVGIAIAMGLIIYTISLFNI